MGNRIAAQEDDKKTIVTDRPDQTESALTVPAGYLQIETGTMFEKLNDDGTKTEATTFNTTLLRLGLFANLELRLGADFQQIKTFDTASNTLQSGMSPLLLGFKSGILTSDNGYDLALMATAFLPDPASQSLETPDTGGEIRILASKDINESWSLGLNGGVAWDGNNTGAAYFYTFSSGHSLSNRLGFFLELYGDFPENGQASHLFDAGFTYLVNPAFQLDLSGGTAIEGDQDFFISAGFSYIFSLKKHAKKTY